jgi:hypothetical protein
MVSRTDFLNLTEVQRILFISRFIEVIVAFTLLGYLVAEMGGRKDESASNSLSRVFGYVLAFAIICFIADLMKRPKARSFFRLST